MGMVYIHENDCYIKLDQGRIILENSEYEKQIPIQKISGIIILGKAQVTSQSLIKLSEQGISIIWASATCKILAKMQPYTQRNMKRERKQLKMTEDEKFSLELSKRFILGKIKNQKVVLDRLYKNQNKSDKLDLFKNIFKSMEQKVQKVEDINELRGCEGFLAKNYFKNLSEVNKSQFKFEKRTKRPPGDEFNSVISFGYTLIMNEIVMVLEAKGLNIFAGFLHEDKIGHPTLSSDLMEEWRPIIVDSLAIRLFNKNKFCKNDFDYDYDKKSVYLNKNGRKIFIEAYEIEVRKSKKYIKEIDKPLTFREAILHQIEKLIKAIETNNHTEYTPVIIR